MRLNRHRHDPNLTLRRSTDRACVGISQMGPINKEEVRCWVRLGFKGKHDAIGRMSIHPRKNLQFYFRFYFIEDRQIIIHNIILYINLYTTKNLCTQL